MKYLRCIENYGYENRITLNKIYKEIRTRADSDGEEFIYVISDTGKETSCFARRFEVVDYLRVGDIITIRDDLSEDNQGTHGLNESMIACKGKTATITKAINANEFPETIEQEFRIDICNYTWTLENFKGFSKNSKGVWSCKGDEGVPPYTKEIDIFDSFNK